MLSGRNDQVFGTWDKQLVPGRLAATDRLPGALLPPRSSLFRTWFLEPKRLGFVPTPQGCPPGSVPAPVFLALPPAKDAGHPLCFTLWASLRSVLSRCGTGRAVSCVQGPCHTTWMEATPLSCQRPRGHSAGPCFFPPLLGLQHSTLGRRGQGQGWAAWDLPRHLPGSGRQGPPHLAQASAATLVPACFSSKCRAELSSSSQSPWFPGRGHSAAPPPRHPLFPRHPNGPRGLFSDSMSVSYYILLPNYFIENQRQLVLQIYFSYNQS